MKVSFKEEDIRRYVLEDLLTDAEIANIYDCHISCVTNYKQRHNIHKPFHDRQWLYNQYCIQQKTIKEIAQGIRTDTENIRVYLRKFGIETDRERARIAGKKYFFNERIFQNIDTPDKAYWLGFITGDGHIETLTRKRSDGTQYMQHRLSILLSLQDIGHLEKFRSFIGDDNIPIKIKKDIVTKFPNGQKFLASNCKIRIFSKQLADDLIIQGITPHKSMCENIPNIPEYLIPHFIRGIIDANGTIGRPCRGYMYRDVRCCGGINLMSWIHKVSKVGRVYHNSKDNPKLFTYAVSGQDASNFLNWIYRNQTICLDRKYERYQMISSRYQ